VSTPYNQNVANSPTNAYPVYTFKLSNGGLVQGVVLSDSNGNEYNASNPLPIDGSFVVSPVTASSATETNKTITAASTKILDANPSRKAAVIRVPLGADGPVRMALAGSASATSRLYQPGDVLNLTIGGCLYTGAVYGIVDSLTVDVEVTEL